MKMSQQPQKKQIAFQWNQAVFFEDTHLDSKEKCLWGRLQKEVAEMWQDHRQMVQIE